MLPTSTRFFTTLINLLFSAALISTVFAQSPSPSTVLTGPSIGSKFGFNIATAGDINGDGYSDVLVGAPSYDSRGAVFVYMGSPNGLATTPALTLSGPAENSQFGTSVGTAGDVNDDGFSDVIIGTVVSPEAGAPSIGSAYVYLGSAVGLSSIPANMLAGTEAGYFGTSSVSGVGDVNGDGFSDVMIGRKEVVTDPKVMIYLGSSDGLPNLPSQTLSLSLTNYSFGGAITGMSDMTGDGISEVLVSAFHQQDGKGAVYLYEGSSLGLKDTPLSITYGTANGAFGSSISSTGAMDFVGGAPGVIIGDHTGKGKAHIYLGGVIGLSETPGITLPGVMPEDNFGFSVSSAGDFDGDGYPDVLIGAASYDSDGNSHVYFHKGVLGELHSWRSQDLISPQANSAFGKSLACAGDVNGDGYSDVIIGAFEADLETGAVYVYEGGAAGLSEADTRGFRVSFFDHEAGRSVAGAGDVNGDGFADIIAGLGSPKGAGVYLGSTEGVSYLADFSLVEQEEGSGFAKKVAGAGDVNGDGFSDVIVGAPEAGSGSGAAYLYLGGAGGLSTTPVNTLKVASAKQLGFSAASAGDLNGDGFGDVVVGAPDLASGTGSAYIYLGKSSGLDIANPILLSNPDFRYFGHSVAGAGDVNGDGFGDLIIGAPTFSDTPGAAVLYYGNASASFSNPAVILTSNGFSDFYGFGVAGIGDANGDGFSDIAVTDPTYSSKDGRVHIYYGSSSGIQPAGSQAIESPDSAGMLGWSVSGAGDVNGDGYSDLVAGALTAFNAKGALYVFFGSENGIHVIPDQFFTGFFERDFVGRSVGAAGDVDGDGFSDVISGRTNLGINGDGHGVVVDNTSSGRSSGSVAIWFANKMGSQHKSLRLYNTDLKSRITAENVGSNQFGIGVFLRPLIGGAKARLVWETQPNGHGFQHSSPIGNSNYFSGSQSFWTTCESVTEFKTLIDKSSGKSTKFRVRMQYKSSNLPFGQTFGPWIYPQDYLNGNLGQTGAPLPVSLMSFHAKKEGGAALLRWETSSEVNSDRFEIEHSTSGKTWHVVGTSSAKGDVQTERIYTFVHPNPVPGLNFYRLKMVDKDETFTYSQIRTLSILPRSRFTIHPNPVSNRLEITLGDEREWTVVKTITITNAKGQLVYTPGKPIDRAVNIESLPAGDYIISIEFESNISYHTRFFVTR